MPGDAIDFNNFNFFFSFVSAPAVVIVSVDGVGCNRGALFHSRHYLLCKLWS